jgi:hypothetical protein
VLTVRIYLHSEHNRPQVLFRAQDLEEQASKHGPHQGLRGWFERTLAHYKSAWWESEGGVVRWLRGVWDWLHRRTYHDEPLLAHLRHASAVEIAHASVLSRDDAQKLWRTYLASRRRRHGIWFAVNALVAPVTIVLAPLPGPNLIGYWFAYRAVHHGLILAGLRKVKQGRVVATFHEVDEPMPVDATIEANLSEQPGQPHSTSATAGSST